MSTIKDFQQIKKFILGFFMVAGFIVIVQFAAMFKWGYFSLTLPPSEIQDYFLYMQTLYLFISNSTLGSYYAFFLLLLLAMILNMPEGAKRPVLILGVSIFSFALFNTYSRSAYLGLFVGVFLLAILKEKRLFLAILMMIIFAPIFLQSAVLEKITVTIQSFRPLIFDASATARLRLWTKGLAAFLRNPIFGTGYWSTRYIIKSEAHSQYVAYLVDIGIVGFSAFCWLVTRMFKSATILMKKGDTDFLRALGLGYIVGLAAILTAAFFYETFEEFRMTGPLWFITALVVSANRLLLEKNKKLEIDST